jgi:Flp pilus assembly protein TadG
MKLNALKRLRREDGQAMTELALVLPVFVVLLFAIIQFGIAFNNYLTLTDATRAGARKAAVSRFIGDNGASAVAAVKTSASGLDQATLAPGISVTSTNASGAADWTTSGDVVTVTATYPYTINLFGFSVTSGSLTSTTKERLE